MNIKTLAAVVGTLSLASLATGCATTKAADAGTSSEKGAQASCKGMPAANSTDKGSQASCKGSPAATPEKAGNQSCGTHGCNGAK